MDVDKNAFICISWLLSIFRPLPNRSGTMPGVVMKKMKPAGVKSLPG